MSGETRCPSFFYFGKNLHLAVLIAACASFFAFPGWSQVISFSDFSDPSTLTINGDASVANTQDGAVLRLAPDGTYLVGSAFFTQVVDISNFNAFVVFRISDPNGPLFNCNSEPGADGLVFIIQPASPTAIGASGDGMGYAGIPDSVGVEFDTWCNGSTGSTDNNDPSSNHLGIDTYGSVDHGPDFVDTVNITPDFDNGLYRYAWISYDGEMLEVRVSQTPDYPAQPQLSTFLDIVSIISGGGSPTSQAFVGFSAATGAGWANHDILTWTFGPAIFANGFESGDTSAWSSAVP